MTTVNTDKHNYELVQDWGRLPEGWTYGVVSSVASDSQDRVYVYQRKDPPVVVFDSEGNYLHSWGISAFNLPHGFCIVDNIVYLTDREDSVCLKYTLDGKPLMVLGERGVHSDTGCENAGDLVPRAAGPFNYPSEMFPSPSGDLYVSDGYRNSRVHRFTKDGRLIQSWGAPGKGGPGEFHLPHSILIDEEELVYVCDRENSRIQVFSPDGEFITMWTDMARPNDICQSKDGDFYVAESSFQGSTPGISVRDKQGKVLARWDSRSAHGLWVDNQDSVYLALTSTQSVDKYMRRD
ncbi:MAG TPA: peptidyl-alpha-hydroxyglycine alpha-amidating lyase family protein [Dehalococcoidia bacterium]|jgi:DNA-binding beta-propeller fold protein YncE|nr:peptidyl-alpha-hydroxyglycine alpha-amidating lyase family protein [Dehalococcoidia bacterium]